MCSSGLRRKRRKISGRGDFVFCNIGYLTTKNVRHVIKKNKNKTKPKLYSRGENGVTDETLWRKKKRHDRVDAKVSSIERQDKTHERESTLNSDKRGRKLDKRRPRLSITSSIEVRKYRNRYRESHQDAVSAFTRSQRQ